MDIYFRGYQHFRPELIVAPETTLSSYKAFSVAILQKSEMTFKVNYRLRDIARIALHGHDAIFTRLPQNIMTFLYVFFSMV